MPLLYKKNVTKKTFLSTSELTQNKTSKSQRENEEFKQPYPNYEVSKTPVTPEQINFKATRPMESASFEIIADSNETRLDNECMDELEKTMEKFNAEYDKSVTIKKIDKRTKKNKGILNKSITDESKKKINLAKTKRINTTISHEKDSNISVLISTQTPTTVPFKEQKMFEAINGYGSYTESIKSDKISSHPKETQLKANEPPLVSKKKRSSNKGKIDPAQKENETASKKLTTILDVSQVSDQSSFRSSDKYKEAFQKYMKSQSQFELSQPSEELTHKEHLLWLQERRNVGLNVQCDKCDKWRYLANVQDPLELPDFWYCHMNEDEEHNKCSIPERYCSAQEEEDFIHNDYNAGSIVWAKLDGYSWWPAMVDDDPDNAVYYWLENISEIPTWYHVVFFDSSEVSRGWVKTHQIIGFKQNLGKKKYDLPKSQKLFEYRYTEAKKQAIDALKLNILERLKKYSFVSRWKKGILKPKIMTDGKRDTCFDTKNEETQKKIKKRAKKELDINNEKVVSKSKIKSHKKDNKTSSEDGNKIVIVKTGETKRKSKLPKKTKDFDKQLSIKSKTHKTDYNSGHDLSQSKKSENGKNKFCIENFAQSPEMFADDFGINDSPISNLSEISIPFNINFE